MIELSWQTAEADYRIESQAEKKYCYKNILKRKRNLPPFKPLNINNNTACSKCVNLFVDNSVLTVRQNGHAWSLEPSMVTSMGVSWPSLPDSSSGVSSRMWVRIPAVTLVSLSKTLNHNCFSPPRG